MDNRTHADFHFAEINFEKDPREIKILVIEDNLADAQLIEEMILLKEKTQWKLQHAATFKDGLRIFNENHFDIILLDLFLPDSHGLETLAQLHAHKLKIPIIVFTGMDDEKTGIEALRQGAQDYLVKGQMNADLFIRTLQYAIERKHLDLVKDELISYVNHELGNPLTIMKEGVSQVVEGVLGDINDQQRKYLSAVLSNIERLQRITEDLLDTTKIEFGKLLLEKTTFDIVVLARETLEIIRKPAEQKHMELRAQFSSNSIMVYADKNRIAQILINLLNNALKYTSQGHIELSIKENHNHIECKVSDTGHGIADSDVPKVFKKFTRFTQKDGEKTKGTGIGLYICKELVEMHGGKIWVETKLDVGTQFIFTIPKTHAHLSVHSLDSVNEEI